MQESEEGGYFGGGGGGGGMRGNRVGRECSAFGGSAQGGR